MSEYIEVNDKCRLCGSKDIERSIQLEPVPIISPNVSVENRIDEKLHEVTAPLDNYVCAQCGLNQLIHVVDPALIYKNYLYETNISLGLNEHFKGLQETITKKLGLKAGARVVEFGSNDGTLLLHFKNEGMQVHGVDPADKASETARARGVQTTTDFFSAKLARQLAQDFGAADAIISNNTMANIDDLEDIFTGVAALLSPTGVFVFETQYALDVLEKTLLDVIYHEHITYFSVRPLVEALGRFDLQLFHADLIPTKGGSIRFWIQKRNAGREIEQSVHDLMAREQQAGLYDMAIHKAFETKVKNIAARVHALIDEAEKAGGRVAAYGTSVGSAALIHQFRLQDRLACLFDDKPTKDLIEGPGYALPVKGPGELPSSNPALVIVLAWRYADVIAAKHPQYFAQGGKFFVPLPDGRFITQDGARASAA